MLKKEIVGITYAITITVDHFFEVMRKDGDAIVEDGKTLFNQLDALSYVDKVEYDGHFGPHIWLDILYHNHDPVGITEKQMWEEIERIITDYIGVKDNV